MVDRGLRLGLLMFVVVLGAALFALALLPSVGAAGRGVQRFADRFNAIGNDVDLRFPKFPERSRILAADGTTLATLFFDENRKLVTLDEINDHMIDALLAIEDSRFYEHAGLDYIGIIRAAFENVASGEVEQGASTLTQQLARNVFEDIGKERTLERKIAEARVAQRLEEVYTKDQILELYMNEVYMGRSVFGIGTAAEFYFGKTANELTLPEAATLAGLIARPEGFSPVVDPEASTVRRNIVLDRMAELGYVTEQEATAAKAAPLELNQKTPTARQKFPFFVEFVKAEILDMDNHEFDEPLGRTRTARERALFQGGLTIRTTLEPSLQRAGTNATREWLGDPDDPRAAIASVNAKTGAIKSLVSSQTFKQSQVNLASGQGGSGRQPGSAFKPFTLVAAFEEGIPPEAVYDGASGQPVDGCGPTPYTVVNAGGGGGGFMDLWAATRGSVNAVFVQLAVDAGLENMAEVAQRMGIESEIEPFCAAALGTEEVSPLEMASAYQTLANGGVHCEPFAVLRVEDRDGKRIVPSRKGMCEEVIEPEIAALTVNLMRGVVTGGTGTRANLPDWPVFGKTGTTNDSGDAWFSGCTIQICTATWVGHEEGRTPMEAVETPFGTFSPVYGGGIPAGIWHEFMLTAMEGLPAMPLPGVPSIKWPTFPIPDVVGLMQDEAEREIGEAGFSVEVEMIRSTEDEGTVVTQSPEGGSKVTKGTKVLLEVSNGKVPKVKVPDLVGMTERQAVKALENAGLFASVVYEPTADKSQNGIVSAQGPGAGTKTKEGATVTITVLEFVKPAPTPPPSPVPPTPPPPSPTP